MTNNDFKRHKITDPVSITIDNLVYDHRGDLHLIGSRDFERFRYPNMDGVYGLYGIPLNEEWLIKLGLFKEEYVGYFTEPRIYKVNWEITEFVLYDDYNKLSVEIEFVHELQNLYYCLTGLQLTIKN